MIPLEDVHPHILPSWPRTLTYLSFKYFSKIPDSLPLMWHSEGEKLFAEDPPGHFVLAVSVKSNLQILEACPYVETFIVTQVPISCV